MSSSSTLRQQRARSLPHLPPRPLQQMQRSHSSPQINALPQDTTMRTQPPRGAPVCPSTLPGLPTPEDLDCPPVLTHGSRLPPPTRDGIMTRVANYMSNAAASPWMTLGVLGGVAGWGVDGIIGGVRDNWLASISNYGSVQVYFWDIFMASAQPREQKRNQAMLDIWTRSSHAKLKMIDQAMRAPQALAEPVPECEVHVPISETDATAAPTQPKRTWLQFINEKYGKTSDVTAKFLGSPYGAAMFDASTVVWLAFGPRAGWGDTWQLWANATWAAQQSVLSGILHNVRHRNANTLDGLAKKIECSDQRLDERMVRGYVAGQQAVEEPPCAVCDDAPEVVVQSEAATRAPTGTLWNRIGAGFHTAGRGFNRIAEKNADVWMKGVGSPAFLGASVVLGAAWVTLGRFVFGFDNDTWFLMLGTYTGLCSFIDDPVMRNAQKRDIEATLTKCNDILTTDAKVMAHMGLEPTDVVDTLPKDVFHRVNRAIANAAAAPGFVVGSEVMVAVLLLTASVMNPPWSVTGQLLCNTPTMWAVSRMLHILLAGNSDKVDQTRARFEAILSNRQKMHTALDAWSRGDALPPPLMTTPAVPPEDVFADAEEPVQSPDLFLDAQA